MIRPCRQSDAPRICEIYNYYVRDTVITFEEEPVADGEMVQRIERITQQHPWIVYEEGGAVAGYAYAGPWHARTAYRFTTESTIYLAPDATGRGIGSQLYAALLTELRRRKVHCVVGAIALPHPASVALHEKLGFAKVGQIKDMGYKLGRWVDVGYWQLLFKAYR